LYLIGRLGGGVLPLFNLWRVQDKYEQYAARYQSKLPWVVVAIELGLEAIQLLARTSSTVLIRGNHQLVLL